MVEVVNSTSTVLDSNQAIPFTKSTIDSNNRIDFNQSTNSIVITKEGNYEINASFVFAPTSVGATTITAYANGQPIPNDFATFTAAATNIYTFTLPSKLIQVVRSTSGQTVAVNFVVSAEGTLSNAVASVKYVE